jgi:hypothetical protein
MKISKKRWILLSAIALVAVILFTIIAAPSTNKLNSGSTYNLAPDGYGAWYAFMAERGTPIQRWQKPFEQIKENSNSAFVRIYPQLLPESVFISKTERDWVKKGNTFVILGVRQPVTEAAFKTLQTSSTGEVRIDTRRRKNRPSETLLGDRFGAVVWSEKFGQGQIVYCVTPYLAANAYQDFRSNYEFLAQLVTRSKDSVLVDEYLHGYKDKDVIEKEIGENLFTYFAQTPLFPLLIQGFIIILIIILAKNRRFGKPILVTSAVIENSTAYIQALAGILQKAKSSEFLVSTIAKEEQRQLQKALGLEETLLSQDTLVNAWVEQTGKPATELTSLFKVSSQKMSEVDLLIWMKKWQKVIKG